MVSKALTFKEWWAVDASHASGLCLAEDAFAAGRLAGLEEAEMAVEAEFVALSARSGEYATELPSAMADLGEWVASRVRALRAMPEAEAARIGPEGEE